MTYLKKYPKIKKKLSQSLLTGSSKVNKRVLMAAGVSAIILSPKLASGVFEITVNGSSNSYNDGQTYNISTNYTCPAVSAVVNGHFSRAATAGNATITMRPDSHSSHGSHGQW